LYVPLDFRFDTQQCALSGVVNDPNQLPSSFGEDWASAVMQSPKYAVPHRT
jgi:hypothetical protein